ncbi:MAG: bifunctional precorrin-2 dehydrogenase/sirohydrochlorin ferrochelatase [Dehalococcoidia bacterium]|nr:bifunctional precorrin-2 dehydrogenase/sirohydrochlorin ferrochelatase [Dehalococcoidia bacterium]
MADFYPVFLDLRNRKCVVIGGDAAAEGKIGPMLACGARIEIVSLGLTEHLQQLATSGKITWHKRHYRRGDLQGAFMAIVADTSNPAVNEAVNHEAEHRNCLLNVMDVPHLCNWIAPAVVHRGPVTVAVSTGGLSPALARRLREDLDKSLQRGTACCIAWADAGEMLGEVRGDLRSRGVIVASDHWQACMTTDVLEMVRQGKRAEARKVLTARLEAGAQPAGVKHS